MNLLTIELHAVHQGISLNKVIGVQFQVGDRGGEGIAVLYGRHRLYHLIGFFPVFEAQALALAHDVAHKHHLMVVEHLRSLRNQLNGIGVPYRNTVGGLTAESTVAVDDQLVVAVEDLVIAVAVGATDAVPTTVADGERHAFVGRHRNHLGMRQCGGATCQRVVGTARSDNLAIRSGELPSGLHAPLVLHQHQLEPFGLFSHFQVDPIEAIHRAACRGLGGLAVGFRNGNLHRMVANGNGHRNLKGGVAELR